MAVVGRGGGVGLYSVDVCLRRWMRFPLLMMLSDGECLLIVPVVALAHSTSFKVLAVETSLAWMRSSSVYLMITNV
jgi:hypothetical protein